MTRWACWLETRIPPPLVMLLAMAAAWGIARSVPGFRLHVPCSVGVAVALCILGLVLNLWPKRAFKHVGTTVNPLRPAASTHLVTAGAYRYTRNPMYLGHALMLCGCTVYLGHALAYALVPLFMAYVTRFQIRPEERVLARRFAGYAMYCRRVRRWL